AAARVRLLRAYPAAPAKPVLRDVQHALARERGYESWKAMTAAARATTPVLRAEAPALDQLVLRFLEYACPDHHVRGRPAHRVATHAAMRLLQQHPEIARHDIYTAVVCGEVEHVRRRLRERPELAKTRNAARGRDRSGSGGSM